jgi:hypothetical protein
VGHLTSDTQTSKTPLNEPHPFFFKKNHSVLPKFVEKIWE